MGSGLAGRARAMDGGGGGGGREAPVHSRRDNKPHRREAREEAGWGAPGGGEKQQSGRGSGRGGRSGAQGGRSGRGRGGSGGRGGRGGRGRGSAGGRSGGGAPRARAKTPPRQPDRYGDDPLVQDQVAQREAAAAAGAAGGGGRGAQPQQYARMSDARKAAEGSARAGPRRRYPPHWSKERVAAALESGEARVGRIRMNANNRREAYITLKGVPHDVLVQGLRRQNRAIEADEVVYVLLDVSEWRRPDGKDANGRGRPCGRDDEREEEEIPEGEDAEPLPPPMSAEEIAKVCEVRNLRPWARVVAIAKDSPRRERLVGTLRRAKGGGGGGFVLYPSEQKFPDFFVPAKATPFGDDALDDGKKDKRRGGGGRGGAGGRGGGGGGGGAPRPGRTPEGSGRLHEYSEGVKVAGHFSQWSEFSQMPMATVTAVLGRVGSLEAETAAILHEFNVPSNEFPPEVFEDLPQGEALTNVDLSAPGGALDAPRRDLREWRITSIDPPTARDLDDALSIRELPNGRTEVGVHIADVTHYVVPGTSLDAEAAERSTSTYLIDGVIPMLPRPLCEHLCSLQPGVDRLAFSITWEFDKQGNIHNEWAGRSIIRSCGQLAYQNAYNLMQGLPPDEGDIKLPELHNGVTWNDVAHDVKALWRIGSQLRRKRFADGALALHRVKFGFKLDETGQPTAAHHYKTNEANQLVEEFMLLANRSVARIIAEEFPDRALLRRHPPPDKKKLGDLASFAAKHGLSVDTRTSKSLHESLQKARQTYRDQGLADVIVHFATKPMQLAMYFSCGMAIEADWPHYALAMERYTHFTSPIRRYADVVVHRMLAAALDIRAGAVEDHEAAIAKWQLYECEDADRQASRCNERKEAAKMAQEASERLYLCLLLNAGKEGDPRVARVGEGGVNRYTDGLIVSVGSKFISVFLPHYSIESRCYLDDIHPDLQAAHDPDKFTVTLTGGPAGGGRTLRILDHCTVELHAVFPNRGPCQIRTTLLVGEGEEPPDTRHHLPAVAAAHASEDV